MRNHLALAAATPLVAAILWWWVVFRQVVSDGYISFGRAVPCIVASSSRCTLAQALCSGQHLLGIRHYDVTLFWIGVGIASAASITALARIPCLAGNWRGTKDVRPSKPRFGAVRSWPP
jgi:hypothetical protein